jgi:hypothetical protein
MRWGYDKSYDWMNCRWTTSKAPAHHISPSTKTKVSYLQIFILAIAFFFLPVYCAHQIAGSLIVGVRVRRSQWRYGLAKT